MQALIDYTLYLADNSLILGHQNSEWCGHGPILEQDIAITNISLDLIGQARYFYQYAAELINRENRQATQVTEDSLAYLRDNRAFRNCLLVEQPNGDWAKTILREFLYSTYQFYLYQQLQLSNDRQWAAIAEKSLKEVTYHMRWSSEWVIRLGDGTEQSQQRMQGAVDELWMYTGELFVPTNFEQAATAKNKTLNTGVIRASWEKKIKEIFAEATLPYPREVYMQTGGKEGKHSENLGYILAELQFMQRAYPGCEW